MCRAYILGAHETLQHRTVINPAFECWMKGPAKIYAGHPYLGHLSHLSGHHASLLSIYKAEHIMNEFVHILNGGQGWLSKIEELSEEESGWMTSCMHDMLLNYMAHFERRIMVSLKRFPMKMLGLLHSMPEASCNIRMKWPCGCHHCEVPRPFLHRVPTLPNRW